MHLDLTDEETRALLNLLIDTIEADRYPMSPRIRVLQEINLAVTLATFVTLASIHLALRQLARE
jgi:hypothetical protein